MVDALFPLDRSLDIQEHPTEFKIQERVPLTRPDILSCLPYEIVPKQLGEAFCPLVFIAASTTGYDASRELMIELALVRCTYSITRHTLISVDRYYQEFEDPRFPLSEKVMIATKLNNQFLSGKYFDESQVRQLLADHPLMICFNPNLVRPFFERRFPSFADLSWAHAGMINWKELGFKHNSGLAYILSFEDYFFNYGSAGEQALSSCFLMTLSPQGLEAILQQATQVSFVIEAHKFPFDKKDLLKGLRFRWNSAHRVWSYSAKDKEEFDQIWAALVSADPTYAAAKHAKVFQITAKERYKD